MKPIADISSWQKSRYIDYERLVKSVRGVILRCAYGLDKDTEFEGHYRRLSSLGMPLGVYHFPLDGNANAQVDLFGECIEGKYFELGGAVDVEHPPRPDRLSKATVDTFITGVRSRLDAKLAVYTTLYKWREIMRDSTDYASHPLWVANYGARVPALPVPWKKWCIWQYTNTGRVDGYAGNVDLNYYNEACLEKIKPLGAYPVITPPEPDIPSEPEPIPDEPKPLYRAKVIASDGLIVRAAPALTSKWVASAMPGEMVNIWEEAANNRVRIDKGWISSVWQGKATIARVQEQLPPDTEPVPVTPDYLFEARVVTSYDYLPIRTKPNTTAQMTGKLYNGDTIKVLEACKDLWYRIGDNQWVWGRRCYSLQEPLKSLAYPMARTFPVSQRFGVNSGTYAAAKGHNGIDWACYRGTQLIAAADGIVETVELYTQYGYGRHVRIRVQGGVLIYGHMLEVHVTEGQRVRKGDVIGLSDGEKGNKYAGFSTGAHLHFEYRIDREPSPLRPGNYTYWAIDPWPLLESYSA